MKIVSILLFLAFLPINAGKWALSGPGAKYLSSLNVAGCDEDTCIFYQRDDQISINNVLIESISAHEHTVEFFGDESGTVDNDIFYYSYFADTIYDKLKGQNKEQDFITCKQMLVPFALPMMAYHHLTICQVKGNIIPL